MTVNRSEAVLFSYSEVVDVHVIYKLRVVPMRDMSDVLIAMEAAPSSKTLIAG